MRSFDKLTDLQALVGQHVADSDWITIDQHRIDLFAEATGDHQWIHVDPVRAAAGPFGTTVAHGFLTLSLLPEMGISAFELRDTRMGVNYGLNRVRFPAPVPVGSRLRGRFKLLSYEADRRRRPADVRGHDGARRLGQAGVHRRVGVAALRLNDRRRRGRRCGARHGLRWPPDEPAIASRLRRAWP